MILDYISGMCMQGTERRSEELNYKVLNKTLGMPLHPGTFNIQLDQEVPFERLGPPFFNCTSNDEYRLYLCGVGLPSYITDKRMPIPGWILREANTDVPPYFVEVVSIFNIRKELKLEDRPSTRVQLALECTES